MEFRKETFEIVFQYYKCEDSEEQYTTTVLDEVNLNQVYNQYRDKFNIPFPDEILRIREKYGVSASRMAAILGFGTNSYRQYESGEMPSISNAKLIQLADNPGRNEPGTGEINYDFLFDFIDKVGYKGWIGCEYKPLKNTAAGLPWIEKYEQSHHESIFV